jgi:hypothetical protein
MTSLSDERIFSDSLLGPPSGHPIMKSKQGLVFLSRLMASSIGAVGTVANDHVVFVSPSLQVGNNITIDTSSPYTTVLNTPSTGRITLQPGKYFINASVLEGGTTADNGVIEVALRNADSGAFLNPTGIFGAGTDRTLLHDKAVVTITTPTRIEFNFVFATGLGGYAKSFIEIEQLA